MGYIDGEVGWQCYVLINSQNVFSNDDGLAVTRTVLAVEKGCCLVQIVNVTDTDLTTKARVPLHGSCIPHETRFTDGVWRDIYV